MEKAVWICIEKAENNYGAFAPEVTGCIATGGTIEEAKASMVDALAFHFEGMLQDGESLDRVTGEIPTENLVATGDKDDYWTLVHVNVSAPEIKAGV